VVNPDPLSQVSKRWQADSRAASDQIPASATLLGDGEMAERIRAFDWSRTRLGPPARWSLALKTTLRIMLANRFPHVLWWGPQYIQFYNDAYRPIPGAKHPDRAFGLPASECWPEIWHVIGPLIDRPFRGGPATWNDDIFLEVRRHGFLEESHFVIAYSPVPDETVETGIGGVLATVYEITEKIVAERRVRVLRDLGARAGEAKSAEEACAAAAATLAGHPKDVPFALFYLFDPAKGVARLAGTAGVAAGSEAAPEEIPLGDGGRSGWPLGEAARTEAMQVVERLGERFAFVPPGPWSDPPETAVIVPIPSTKAHDLAALIVLGVSARLNFDQSYRDFFHLLQTQVAAAIANGRAHEEERQRAEALAEIDRAKTAFFSNVSHEFRTPLTLMLGPVEDLLGRGHGALPSSVKEPLEVVHRNGLRLLRLVNTLLDFSRIEAGRVRASFRATDLSSLTEDLAGVFRSAFEKAGLRLTLDCPTLAGPIYVDREMWEKIVLNLLSNAFKYTFEGSVNVSLKDLGDAVELRVRDTGIGISENEIPRLFERFHRVENARARTHEGSGIGLALVQELVHLHGGLIRAASVPGRGSTFIVRLPTGTSHLPREQIVEDDGWTSAARVAAPFVEEALRWLPDFDEPGEGAGLAPRPESLPVPPVASRSGGSEERPRVLVADDNADMRNYLARLLSERYEVETAADGEHALEAARRDPPALVLTDVMMPGLDGFGLLGALRSDADLRDTPVIVLSARAGEESRVEGLEAGADDYLVKPFSARELLARVEAHLKMVRLRRQASDSIRQSNDRLRYRADQFETLLEKAPIGVYLIDADFRVVEVNPVAAPIFRSVPGGPVGRDFGDVIRILRTKDDADEVVRIFRRTLETGASFVAPERAGPGIHGGVNEYYDWRVDRITLPDGRHGLVCYFRDISVQVHAKRERERLLHAEQAAREEAVTANRLKDEFVATLSHELRTPLNAIMGWSELLKRGTLDPAKTEQGIDAIHRSALAQAQLIEDLLDMSRIISGKLRLELRAVLPSEPVEAAISAVTLSANAKEIRVEKQLDPAAGVVLADGSRLQQVVWNLLTNAIKFTPRGGRIDVGLARAGGAVEITVRDTGAGITAEFLPAVFDRFRQADPSASRRHGGLGIGLTLVKELVELHGGSVGAHSDGADRGSTFTVTLPVMSGRVSEEIPSFTLPSGGMRLDGVDVLYVDDDPESRILSERILSDCAANVLLAGSASEALELLRAKRPHVLVSDIGLPVVDGYELIRKVRRLPAEEGGEIPAAAVTAFAASEDRRKALVAGYQCHLSKPIVPDELVSVVASLALKR
jgi:signal transduction histidine kinase/CheY-like chemotaxis protein